MPSGKVKLKDHTCLAGGQFCISKSLGRAESGTGRIPLAKITFDYLAMHFIDQSTSKRTGGHTGHAFDTAVHIELNRTRLFITAEGLKKT